MGEQSLWRFEVLTRKHDRTSFDCGDPSLNDFLRRFALQQQGRNLGKTFVAVKERRIIGFYTLSAGSVAFDDLPEAERRRLPRYPIPVVRIGRLAVDRSVAGKGFGKLLLLHALVRVAQLVADEVGVFAVVVDAKNETVAAFYEKYGFRPLPERPRTLFLPVETIRRELLIPPNASSGR